MNEQPRKTFIKLFQNKALTPYLKEARRVKYKVVKTDLIFTVTDPDNKDAVVFKGVQVRPGVWGVTFSTDYWADPDLLPQTPAHAGV